MELASYHRSGTQNFEVAPRFLEYLCTPALDQSILYLHTGGLSIVIILYI